MLHRGTGRRGAPRRWTALALAALCAGGQLAGVAHYVLVEHVTCPEHGELIHVEDRSEGNPVASHTEATSLPETSVFTAGRQGEPSSPSHDACVVSAHRRERFVTGASSLSVLVVHAESTLAAPALESRALHGIPLFLLAPKNSPPRSA